MAYSCVQGYFYKAAALGADDLVSVADAAVSIVRAQLLQTIGMRILFFFPVTVRLFPLHSHFPCFLLLAGSTVLNIFLL
jgi:hypothetical protein